MIRQNRPVTSREYKLMLNTDRFVKREDGKNAFFKLLRRLVEKEGGSIEENDGEGDKNVKTRLTSYLDTAQLALHQNGYSLRLREDLEKPKFEVNIKYRGSDRYISAARDLSSPEGKKKDLKFEEDILPPFVSKFSHSNKVEMKSDPRLESFAQVVELFPGLSELKIAADAPIKTVSDFKAEEIVIELCKIKFNDPLEVKASLSFWYFREHKDEWPLVGEFSFDYDAPYSEGGEAPPEDRLEAYPASVVEGANGLFGALQKQTGWLSFNTTTKTAFALEVL